METNADKSSVIAIADNFLFAALQLAALKHIPFKRGVLPDLPSSCPTFSTGFVLESGSNSESRYVFHNILDY